MTEITQATGAAMKAERLAVSLRMGSVRQGHVDDSRTAIQRLDTILAGLKDAGADATIWSAAHEMPGLTPAQRQQAMTTYGRCQRARSDLSSALAYTEREVNRARGN